MKKYKRKKPLCSPFKIAIAALYAAIAAVLILVFSGPENAWYIICGGISAALFIADFFIIIAVGGRYRYTDDGIKILYQSICHRTLKYSSFNAVVISNASYNNGYGYGPNGNIPMQYKVKKNNNLIKVTFPFITLHKSEYPIDKVKAGMNSRDLFVINNSEVYFLGICWFDAFRELLKYSDYDIYILEDVYLRFKGQFDIIFSEHQEKLNRFYIITNHSVSYQSYCEGKQL